MLKNYLKIAIKVLLRRKMFTFISLFGICFTLSILLAATAVYTYKVVSNPIEKNLSRTLFLSHVEFKNNQMLNSGSVMAYLIESSVKSLANTEIISFYSFGASTWTTYINNNRVDIDTRETDENYFKALTFNFLEGRPYSKEEIESGGKVVIICNSLSKRYFGGAKAIGKNITLNKEIYRIVGVVEDVPKLYQTAYSQLWKPYNYASYMNEVQHKTFGSWAYKVMIVAKSTSDFDAIRSQLAKRILQLKPPDNFVTIKAELESSFDLTFGDFYFSTDLNQNQNHMKRIMSLLLMLVLFLLLPLLNLTNLTVSRVFERFSEIGVRKAFGATKRQMINQFIYENLVVTILGGIFGFGGAWLLLVGINSIGIMDIGTISFSFRLLFYGLLVIISFGLISGLYPAMKMSKLQIVDIMKGGNK